MPIRSTAWTAAELDRLNAGEAGWFFFCDAIDAVAPPLLFIRNQRDPDMGTLMSQVLDLDLPEGARTCVGLAQAGPDGRLDLGSDTAEEGMLEALATWVKREAPGNPALARLANASFVRFDDEGRIVARYRDDAVWDGVSPEPLPGTLAYSGRVLDTLRPGEQAPFWLTRHGPGGMPFLALAPDESDPENTAIREQVRLIFRRSPGQPESISGVARVLESGALMLTTAGDLGTAQAVFSAMSAQPALARLAGASLFVMKDGKYSAAARITPPDHRRLSKILAALKPGSKALFAFTDRARSGLPHLVLEVDRDALKEQITAHRGKGRLASGQVLVGKDGRYQFHTRQPFDGLLEAIADWVSTHVGALPGLSALDQARVVARDGEKPTVVDNPDVWAFLPKRGA